MKLVWDEPKRIANLKKHGLDFADAVLLDWSNALLEPGKTDQFGKQRYKATGRLYDGIASIIFSTLGSEAITVISFRPASSIERKKFDEKNKTSH